MCSVRYLHDLALTLSKTELAKLIIKLTDIAHERMERAERGEEVHQFETAECEKKAEEKILNFHNSLNIKLNQFNSTSLSSSVTDINNIFANSNVNGNVFNNNNFNLSKDKDLSSLLSKSKIDQKSINNINNLNEIFPQIQKDSIKIEGNPEKKSSFVQEKQQIQQCSTLNYNSNCTLTPNHLPMMNSTTINTIANINTNYSCTSSLPYHEMERFFKPVSRVSSIMDTSSIYNEDDSDLFYRDNEYSFDHLMDFVHTPNPFKKEEKEFNLYGTFYDNNQMSKYSHSQMNNEHTHHSVNNTNSVNEHSNNFFDFDMNENTGKIPKSDKYYGMMKTKIESYVNINEDTNIRASANNNNNNLKYNQEENNIDTIDHQINDYANEICLSYFDKIDHA